MSAIAQSTLTPHNDFSLGAVIRIARLKAGLSQQHVAARMGVSKPSVWAWERGRAVPTDEKIPALATILGIPEAELIRQRFRGYEATVHRCRIEIAASLGVSPDAVKITLEL